jgi:ABC-2 type transport system ATP-binding protein
MITIQDLTFSYKKEFHLFKDLNLNLDQGKVYGLLGKNGAGKSTLLKQIAGLLFPQQGLCKVLDRTPKERSPEFLKEVFFIPEEFQFPSIKIEDYVKYHAPFYPRFDHKQFEQYLLEFRITPDKKLSALSFGQKKKILVGFGLATNTKVLILDEPTNGLDIPSKALFRKIIASSLSEERCMIISTHQVKDIENLIDEIIILDEGKIVFQQNLMSIAQKLSFSKVSEAEAKNGVVYSEGKLGLFNAISENRTDIDSNIDMELLFNAVISDNTKIQEILNK